MWRKGESNLRHQPTCNGKEPDSEVNRRGGFPAALPARGTGLQTVSFFSDTLGLPFCSFESRIWRREQARKLQDRKKADRKLYPLSKRRAVDAIEAKVSFRDRERERGSQAFLFYQRAATAGQLIAREADDILPTTPHSPTAPRSVLLYFLITSRRRSGTHGPLLSLPPPPPP